MKFSNRVFNFIVIASGVGILATTVVESSMSIRGNTKTANKLMTFSRRLEDGGQNNYQGGYGNNNNNNNQNNQNGEQGNNYQGGYGNNNNYNGANNNGGGQNGQYGGQYGQQDGGGGGQYGGSYGEMDEESMYFLNNYSIKLLSCIQGEQVINYENGEMESSTVVFRLCPSDSCDADSELGCESGYGDFAVGISTFLEAYMESQQQDNNQDYYGSNNMISYNQYGEEFDAEDYMECKEYDVEEGQGQDQQQNNYNGQYNNNDNNNQYNNNNNNGQQQQQQNNYNQYNNNNQYNNGQRRQLQNNNYNYYGNAQYFIGPGCSADGTTIALGMYMDEYCSYPAEVDFADIAYGWASVGLPFSEGGLVSMNCVACYGPDQDYNYELSEMCMDSYQFSTSRCESNMESYSYYGQKTQGCNYIDSLVESIYGNGNDVDGTDNNSTSSINTWIPTAVNEVSTRFMDTLSTREARFFIAAMVLFSLSAIFGATVFACCCVKKRNSAKLLRATKGDKFLSDAEPMKRRRSSVVALVQNGTYGIAESVKTATTGVKVAVATAAAKSVASIRGKPYKKKRKEEEEVDDDSAKPTEVVYTNMKDPAEVVVVVEEDESVDYETGQRDATLVIILVVILVAVAVTIIVTQTKS